MSAAIDRQSGTVHAQDTGNPTGNPVATGRASDCRSGGVYITPPTGNPAAHPSVIYRQHQHALAGGCYIDLSGTHRVVVRADGSRTCLTCHPQWESPCPISGHSQPGVAGLRPTFASTGPDERLTQQEVSP